MQTEKERREALGHFLRTRREQLSPAEVGLSSNGRRRTPGLRREEVCQLADMGLSWYTWLEQGRAIHVSTDVLERLAQALHLDAAQRHHLFLLAHQSLPLDPAMQEECVSDTTQRVLAALDTTPAYVIGRRWDVLAWNRATVALFDDFAARPLTERNMVWYLFTSPAARQLFVHWEQIAQLTLARFRADIGCYKGDQPLTEWIDCLQQRSPEFRHWWQKHDVGGTPFQKVELDHPVAGRLALESSAFQLEETPALRMIVYTPLPEAQTARKLHTLSDGSAGGG